MKFVTLIIAAALLTGLTYGVIQGFVIAGWQGAAIALVFLVGFMAAVRAVFDTLAAPFSPPRDRQTPSAD